MALTDVTAFNFSSDDEDNTPIISTPRIQNTDRQRPGDLVNFTVPKKTLITTQL